MIPYYFDEAMLQLPRVARLVDRSRHILDIRTEDGAEFELVIARGPMPPDVTLRSCVKADIEDQQRSLRGFELLSSAERSYDTLYGIEVRLRFIDKPGPTFHHEFHTTLGSARIGFHGVARMIHAEACDAWMVEALSNLTLRT
ncbi:MAG TPA: DcrB-related protein [Polyangium sp.]|nr:DcrB-related protein [Polyangium sp.]